MRIEILLKDIRKKRRNKFTATIKTNGNIKFTLELYRKERERTYYISISAYCTSIERKGR